MYTYAHCSHLASFSYLLKTVSTCFEGGRWYLQSLGGNPVSWLSSPFKTCLHDHPQLSSSKYLLPYLTQLHPKILLVLELLQSNCHPLIKALATKGRCLVEYELADRGSVTGTLFFTNTREGVENHSRNFNKQNDERALWIKLQTWNQTFTIAHAERAHTVSEGRAVQKGYLHLPVQWSCADRERLAMETESSSRSEEITSGVAS